MRSLVLFNNKGGVGKTTLTFDRPVAGYAKWAVQVPEVFHANVLGDSSFQSLGEAFERDDQCIATIKHFASLVPTA